MSSPLTFTQRGDLIGDGLACRRGGRLVFAGLSFQLPAGGAMLLRGANGSGKSSLLRLLATLVQPHAGHLVWQGADIRADLPAYRASLHYIGHLDALKPSLTPRETLAMAAALREGPRGDPETALDAFGLAHAVDSPCRWLSAGQRRRLALARVLVSPAPLWLLDEPSTGLDTDSEERLEAVISAHRAAGGRVVIATHVPVAVPGAATLQVDDFTASGAAAADPDELWAAAY